MSGTHAHSGGDRHGRRAAAVAAALALLLAIGGLACIGAALARQAHAPEPALSSAPDPAPLAPGTPMTGPVMTASTPVALRIPAIGVSTRLLVLGRTATGALQVPPPGPHYDEAGWYRYSPTPGAYGPAVIDGHVDSAAHGPSVFFELGALHPGDLAQVTRANGTVAVFRVDAVRRYAKSAFPTTLVYGNTDHAALRLITCGGPFDASSGHYRDNIVVLATLVRAG